MGERFGRYQLIEKLGAGGVAEVYVAQAVDSAEERCTLKRLHRQHADSPDVIQAFLAEAELALKLAHPNLVRVLDFGQVGDDYYIAAEYVEGLDLAELRKRQRLSPAAGLQLTVDICQALDYVHERAQVVHGDVTPANILVGSDGRARVTDFGVAVDLGDTDQPVRGTYAYMSPEQTRGEALDPRSDVFAVGVIVWELIQRKRLFRRDEQFLTLRAVVEDPAPPVDVPQLDPVVQRALMKRADLRYACCGDLADALVEACAALGVSPSREAVAQRVKAALAKPH